MSKPWHVRRKLILQTVWCRGAPVELF